MVVRMNVALQDFRLDGRSILFGRVTSTITHGCSAILFSIHRLHFRVSTRTLVTLLSTFYIREDMKLLAPLPARIPYQRNLSVAFKSTVPPWSMEFMVWLYLQKSMLKFSANVCLFSTYCRQLGRYFRGSLMTKAGFAAIYTQSFRGRFWQMKQRSRVMNFIEDLERIACSM
ncbi:hypothetical protein BDV29DRAFT_176048 [Aspergillus leporis]|uniref:Uncharacterized protein n=1 Tax=Aspergillus leporis TaxID=41062 RepID=A0A5N5WZA5_9EURO|nr:hypothetical protein BDV29DRAFT_176048 [Aspergillus leporis]